LANVPRPRPAQTRPLRLAGGVGLAALAGAAIGWWRPFRAAVAGDSMTPTLRPDDLVLAVRAIPRRGSVAVVEYPDRPGFEVVKRVTGVPGDAVPGLRLEADEYWVEGDAPGSSTDSRTFGPVAGSGLRGVVLLRYWPPSRFGLVR
jgi:type IV secretory pathway protease TraF